MISDTHFSANDDQLESVRQIFQVQGLEYLQNNQCNFETHQAIQDILSCRTELQGGHLLECDHCGTLIYHYNSCNNRNCFFCQKLDELIFVEQIKQKVINVEHYEITVKLPNCLYPFALYYKKTIYQAQMKAVRQLINEIDKQNNYKSGSITNLHTWSEYLLYFVHNHILMTKGGYSTTTEQWITNHNDCPVELETANHCYVKCLAKEISNIPPEELGMTKENQASLCKRILAAKRRIWCGTVDQHLPNALHYLGKFRYSVGIKPNQIEVLDENWIKITSSRGLSYQLRHEEFICRFVKHIVPSGFQKVRYYGIYSNASTKIDLARNSCYQYSNRSDLLALDVQKNDCFSTKIEKCCNIDPLVCPHCKIGRLQSIGHLERGHRSIKGQWKNYHSWQISNTIGKETSINGPPLL